MKKLKYIFVSVSLLLLIMMLLMSVDSGVNCDEVLHYNHSVTVLNFFSSHGRDTSVLNTPVTHLKYYGQSYDNFSTLLIKIFGIDDIYGFRHVMSTIAGWLAIIVTAMLAIWFEGYAAGIIVLLLFAVSPTFLGHAQNNLKDIPFALAYISGICFMFRLFFRKSNGAPDIFLLIISIAFCISIRAGGLILICYLFLFFAICCMVRYFKEGKAIFAEAGNKLLIMIFISAAAFFAGILFWPYAIIDPFKNVLDSYRVMAHFPDTFRQIFEGKSEYSDFMPWYYLPKSMIITIPLLVSAGLLIYFIFIKRIFLKGKGLYYLFLIFSVIFPFVVVLASGSNLYSSWRHFLFIYPGIIVLSAIGILTLIRSVKQKYLSVLIAAALIALAFHPLNYLVRNHRYAYIYFNQLTGGLKGALGNYETDYYFVSQRESAEWLTGYLSREGIKDTVIVGSNFSAEWFFRKQPLIKNKYIRFEERSIRKWDYAIITNRYIPPFQLKRKIWPPKDALKIVYADGIPISAVIKRGSDSSVKGYKALADKKLDDAISFFEEAIMRDSTDDMIFYNFAVALFRKGLNAKADSLFRLCLRLNPDSDPAYMFLGDIASVDGRNEEAKGYYEKVISINRKYPEAYISLAKIEATNDIMKARKILRNCIEINPRNAQAINSLGDTYRVSDPEIAEKYYKLAQTVK